jgi:hypothetical protein
LHGGGQGFESPRLHSKKQGFAEQHKVTMNAPNASEVLVQQPESLS